jgi:hypothetical protein
VALQPRPRPWLWRAPSSPGALEPEPELSIGIGALMYKITRWRKPLRRCAWYQSPLVWLDWRIGAHRCICLFWSDELAQRLSGCRFHNTSGCRSNTHTHAHTVTPY